MTSPDVWRCEVTCSDFHDCDKIGGGLVGGGHTAEIILLNTIDFGCCVSSEAVISCDNSDFLCLLMTSCTHDVRAAGWHRGGASHLFLPWLFHPPKPTKANRTGMHRVRFRLNIPIFIYIPNLPKSVPGEGCKKISVSENAKRQGSR